jgi:hypothetical protein
LYCGNCGHQIQAVNSPIANAIVGSTGQPQPNASDYTFFGNIAANGAGMSLPRYAVDTTHAHNHLKVILAMVFGVIGIAGAFFIPLLGLILGIAGVVLATTATHDSGKWLKRAAFTMSLFAFLSGLGVWAYVANNNPKLHPQVAQKAATVNSSANAITALGVSTPCYSITFPENLNIDNASGSCVMNAYNGKTIEASSNVYKVLTSASSTITSANFVGLSKKAIENDVSQNLPGFIISGEGSGTFAGSQAYFVNAADSGSNVAVEEAAVLHSSATGSEVFIIVHITFGTATNLSILESHWQWK